MLVITSIYLFLYPRTQDHAEIARAHATKEAAAAESDRICCVSVHAPSQGLSLFLRSI